MTTSHDIIEPGETGLLPCPHCRAQGGNSYTRLREIGCFGDGGPHLVLAHWCDKGRIPSSREVFLRAGSEKSADMVITCRPGETIDDLVRTWNVMIRGSREEIAPAPQSTPVEPDGS